MRNTWIDISKTPFSRYGSYVSVTHDTESGRLMVHNVRRRFGQDLSFVLRFIENGKEVFSPGMAAPEGIFFETEKGKADIYISDKNTLTINTQHLDVEILQLSENGYAHEMGNNEASGSWLVFFISYGSV